MSFLKSLGAGLVGVMALGSAWAVGIEEPAYELVASWDDGVEVRHYEPRVLAMTAMNGGESSGFRVLAGYIFGGNASEQEIAMTAPVQRTMASGSGGEMAFVMPAEYALEELPAPDDERVRIRQEPAFHAAVIRFSGRATEERVDAHWDILTAFLEEQQIEAAGRPTLNQYNPPWTLPFMRRNEIIIPINYQDRRTASRRSPSSVNSRNGDS